MANTFKLKRSSVSGKVPTTGDLQLGELAVNTFDGKLYTLKNNGTASVVEIGGVASFSAGTTGLTPTTATTGAITLGGTLEVANGGTGVTTSTGSGSVVLNTSPTLVTPLIGTPTSGTLTNCTGYTFANLASKPTTLSGYGITDAADLGSTNAFTGANTFTNATGQTFRPAATQDGVLLRGRAGGTSSWTVEIVPTTLSANRTLTLANGNTTLVAGTMAALAVANAFTAANTFINSTGQTFRQAATQDGILLRGRPGGTGSFNVELVPATLTASRTLTAPNASGTIITTGDTSTVTNTMLAGSIANAKLANSTISGIALGSNLNAATFNSAGSGAVSGSTFDGSAAVTISYNTVGAPSTTGTNASGTWGISITGNAATATTVNDGTY